MPKCVYCGRDYEFPKGLTLVGKDGKINYLCSSKCRKNMKMKRRKVRWILKKKKEKQEIQKPEIDSVTKSQVSSSEKQRTKEEKQSEKPVESA